MQKKKKKGSLGTIDNRKISQRAEKKGYFSLITVKIPSFLMLRKLRSMRKLMKHNAEVCRAATFWHIFFHALPVPLWNCTESHLFLHFLYSTSSTGFFFKFLVFQYTLRGRRRCHRPGIFAVLPSLVKFLTFPLLYFLGWRRRRCYGKAPEASQKSILGAEIFMPRSGQENSGVD